MLETEEVVKHMKIPVGTNRKVVLASVGCNSCQHKHCSYTQLFVSPASNETLGKVHRNEAALQVHMYTLSLHLVLQPHSSGPFLFMNIPCDGQVQKQHTWLIMVTSRRYVCKSCIVYSM